MTETHPAAGNGSAAASPAAAKIVWLASYPKSGNTWMRTFVWHLLRQATGEAAPAGDGFDFLRQFAPMEAGHIAHFERFLGKPLASASFAEIAAAHPRVQAAIAAAASGVVALKTHSALGIANGAATIDLALTAAAIYIVRNPLDIAVSLADHFGTSIDTAIERMGLENCMVSSDDEMAPEFWGSWSQNVGSWTGSPNPIIMPIRYEDMLSAPEQVFPAVARFLHIPASPEQVAVAREESSFKRLKEMEERSGFHETVRAGQRFFRKGSAGGWRDILSHDQVRRLVAAHHVQMTRVGYMTPDLTQYVPESTR